METKKQNWLGQNIAPILAIFFVVFTFCIFRMVLLKQVCASDAIVTSIVASLTSIITLIIGYYFGSSQGSKIKQDTIDNMNADKKDPNAAT